MAILKKNGGFKQKLAYERTQRAKDLKVLQSSRREMLLETVFH